MKQHALLINCRTHFEQYEFEIEQRNCTARACDNEHDVFTLLKTYRFDLVMVQLDNLGPARISWNPKDALVRILTQVPNTTSVVVSSLRQPDLAEIAFRLGAVAFFRGFHAVSDVVKIIEGRLGQIRPIFEEELPWDVTESHLDEGPEMDLYSRVPAELARLQEEMDWFAYIRDFQVRWLEEGGRPLSEPTLVKYARLEREGLIEILDGDIVELNDTSDNILDCGDDGEEECIHRSPVGSRKRLVPDLRRGLREQYSLTSKPV